MNLLYPASSKRLMFQKQRDRNTVIFEVLSRPCELLRYNNLCRWQNVVK